MKELQYQRQTSNVTNGFKPIGYVKTTFGQLVKAFGQPEILSDNKVTHRWVVNIEGVICTIYDYKDALDPFKPEDWHIGGKQKIAVKLIEQILAEAK
jgi:hypothetical protein